MNIAKAEARPFWRRHFWPLLLTSTIGVGYLLAQISVEIKITEVQAQTMLDEQLAKMQAENPAYETLVVGIDFGDNEMTLRATGSYDLMVSAFPLQRLLTSLTSTGDPDYRSGGIYFNASAFNLEEFLINGEEPGEVVKRLITEAAIGLVPESRNSILGNSRVQSVLDNLGVSVDLVQNDAAISGAALAAEALVDEYRVQGQALLETSVLTVLERTPLYSLGNNWKEQVAMAALSDIGIEDGVFTATLSGLQVLKTLLVFALLTLLVVCWIVALARGNGSGLAAVAVLSSLDN